ncbi:hypothetical protein L2E82_45020 [Cichorium intybus]|uniref:Uncharacterized protein n=1 Tax=Cichorium intybus TaxID=13427 RepID=A0ACB8ZQY6_CICIN|nr:hypothetical protein L2E82_45020 [Cichorium intybus]
MKTIVKSREEDADDSTPLSSLPDEIILQIFNKLIDLKTLCFCYLVSRRFSSIVLQVDAVSFTAPLLNSPTSDKTTSGDIDGDGFPRKLFRLLINGVVLKPLYLLRRMIVPPSKPLPPIISSFYGQMLLYIVKDLPLLEEISITDSARRGRLLLSGGKLADVKNEWVSSALETVKSEMNRIEVPARVSQCYIPVLNMPISGYVMKGVTLVVMEMNGVQGGNDGLMNSEDKEEAAYTEALMEILEKHNDKMKVLL